MVCAPPALATSTISVIAFRALLKQNRDYFASQDLAEGKNNLSEKYLTIFLSYLDCKSYNK
jgi:hypothetical protein